MAPIPRATLARLTPHSHLLSSLQASPPRRSNGRAPDQARPPHATVGSLSHAHGSAVVRTGNTTAVCGVRGETVLASDMAQNDLYSLLVPNIEGQGAQLGLSTRLQSLLHSADVVDIDDLRIWEDDNNTVKDKDEDEDDEDKDDDNNTVDTVNVVNNTVNNNNNNNTVNVNTTRVAAYWVLYIDILLISFDGNAFDVAWAALVAALRDTRLPHASWDADRDMVLCSLGQPRRLALRGLPMACSAAIFTDWLLVDPDAAEESVCPETVSMVFDRRPDVTILAIEKVGGAFLAEELVGQFVRAAEARWAQWAAVLGHVSAF